MSLSTLLLAATMATATPPAGPLKGADCLDPSRARGWLAVDDSTLLVDAGRHKYRITLRHACTGLGLTADVGFRGDPISGRLCGHVGERVLARRDVCAVDRVELIDEATWKQQGQRSRLTLQGGTRL